MLEKNEKGKMVRQNILSYLVPYLWKALVYSCHIVTTILYIYIALQMFGTIQYYMLIFFLAIYWLSVMKPALDEVENMIPKTKRRGTED